MMLALALICLIIGVYWLWSQKRVSAEPPPAPGRWPLVGHLPALYGDSGYLWKSVQKISDQTYSLGGVVSISIGPRTVYVITDPEDALTLVNTCMDKDKFYDFAEPWLGDGLITSKLSTWKVHRKLLQPAFNQIVLDSFIGVFNSSSRKLVRDLEVEIGKGEFDHWPYTRNNALETICLTALGVNFTDENLKNQYVDAIKLLLSTILERFTKPWLYHPYVFNLSGLKKKQDECLKIVRNMCETVLQRKKLELKNNTKSSLYIDDGNSNVPAKKTKFKSFLDLLLSMDGVFTDKEIRDHVDTLIMTGHDSSASAITFTLTLLGSYPEVQQKAVNELKEVLGESNRDVEKSDLSKLVYLEAVLKESTRIYTIIPLIARWLDKDVKLKNCTLSSGRTCAINLYGINRHPIWGPDANEFRPERWFDPDKLPDNPNAFVSFMIGRRICVGKAYAYMSMKITLAHLLRRYRFFADHTKMELKIDVMLKPASGHTIRIENRT